MLFIRVYTYDSLFLCTIKSKIMKKITLLATVLLLIACEKKEKGFVISADSIGFADGTVVYVNAISQSNRPSIVDSATIKNEKFKIELLPVEYKDINYLSFKNTPGNVLFLAENNPILMTIFKDSLRSSIVNGGAENKLFFEYLDKIKRFNSEKINLNNQYQTASRANETEKISKISQDLRELGENEKKFRTDIIEKNSNSLTSVIALTDLLNLKIISPKQVKELYSNLSDTIKTSRLGKNLDRLVMNSINQSQQNDIGIGSAAEDFSAATPEGKMLSLKESLGKVTIIEFWASWCRPCRAENPNLVKVYNKYHDKGLNIIAVSLDKTKDQWIKAIADDKLNWNHVSNLKSWQEPIAQSYGVRSIPASFILDESGNIIAKNIRGKSLEDKISELLDGKAL